MAFTAKVPGFGKLDQQGARQTLSGDEAGGAMQPPTVPQQQPRKMKRGFKRGKRSFGRS